MNFTFNIQNEDSLRVSPFYAAIILHESERFLLIRNFLAHRDGCWKSKYHMTESQRDSVGEQEHLTPFLKARILSYNNGVSPFSPPSWPSQLSTGSTPSSVALRLNFNTLGNIFADFLDVPS